MPSGTIFMSPVSSWKSPFKERKEANKIGCNNILYWMHVQTHTQDVASAEDSKIIDKHVENQDTWQPKQRCHFGCTRQETLYILSSGRRSTPTYKNAPQPLTVDSQNLKSFMNALPQVVEILARAVHLLLPWILSMEDLFVHAFLDFVTDSKSSFSHAGMVLNCSCA